MINRAKVEFKTNVSETSFVSIITVCVTENPLDGDRAK
jgi:hypothetical protein